MSAVSIDPQAREPNQIVFRHVRLLYTLLSIQPYIALVTCFYAKAKPGIRKQSHGAKLCHLVVNNPNEPNVRPT